MALVDLLVGERRATLSRPPLWLQEFFGGATTATGIRVDPDKAMRATVVFLAVKLISEGVGSLPLIIYRMGDEDSRRRDRNHHLWSLLRDTPNRWQTSLEFREMMQGHVLLRGNAYAAITSNNAGRIEELVPMHPDRVRPFWAPNRSVAYEFTPREGERRILLQDEVMHVRGMCLDEDGLKGFSPIEEMREAVALTLAIEEFGARRFSNDARPGGVLQHPGSLQPDQATRLREEWEARHTGVAGAHRVAVLEGGMEWKQIGLSPDDAQFILSRKFQITEIARIFNIPPHKLKDLERATFSNIEEQNREWVVDTLRPWLVRWEQVIHRDLFTPAERRSHFVEFLVEGILRGRIKDRFEAYAIGRNSGWLTANEIRRMENMNPIEGGDVLLIPLNMMPVQQAGDSMAQRMAYSMRMLELERAGLDDDGRTLTLLPAPESAALNLSSAQRRSLTARRRLRSAFAPIFAEAARRLVRFEATRVRQAFKKFLTSRAAPELERWLADFYAEEGDLVERAAGTLRPAVASYFEALQVEAAEEVGAEAGMGAELDRFVEDYAQAFAARYAQSSRGQLDALVRDTDADELAETVEERLASWEETRPAKVAQRETVQGGSALTRAVYVSAGVRILVWVTSGDACPLCQELDGKTISIQESFVKVGDDVDPKDGETAPLTAAADVGHPQLHDGCECDIVAG